MRHMRLSQVPFKRLRKGLVLATYLRLDEDNPAKPMQRYRNACARASYLRPWLGPTGTLGRTELKCLRKGFVLATSHEKAAGGCRRPN